MPVHVGWAKITGNTSKLDQITLRKGPTAGFSLFTYLKVLKI
jgi:hypothetical protein